MVFSSVIFVFLFLPAVLVGYAVAGRRFRNLWLLAASLFFYAWGESFFVLLMLTSIGLNYVFGLLVDRAKLGTARKLLLGSAVFVNLALLGFFKYMNFFLENLAWFIDLSGGLHYEFDPIHLPIGISFFTFQAMSYVIDVYRKDGSVQKNPVNLALYIALFPQLIAGPIIRYQDVAVQLAKRAVTREGFVEGIERFVFGLGKKILIANTVAVPADAIFGLEGGNLSFGLAWLGVLCYTLQIYFDFSGYSDMAIGLGHMFGFRFRENFAYPYTSQSVREFWRRWHISLSTWFRDYLYIPLGGSRGSNARTSFNLLIVFFLCGLWHGASWTFVVWGLYHGVFLSLERTRFGRVLEWLPRPARHGYTLLVAVVGWVFFRAESFSLAASFLRAMAGFGTGENTVYYALYYLKQDVALAIVLGIFMSAPLLPYVRARFRALVAADRPGPANVLAALTRAGAIAVVFLLCIMVLSAQTHNPFIYFRF